MKRERQALGLSVVALVGSGLLVNVLLAVVARSVTEPEYALFSAFWAVALIAGFGIFLPVEQWLAQRPAGDPALADDVRRVGRLTVALVAGSAVVIVGVGAALMSSLGAGPGMLTALIALCAVSGVQFLTRGVLISRGRLDLFAVVLLADVVVRVGIALALSQQGVDHATPYAWAVVVGIGIVHLPVLALSRYGVRGPGDGREVVRPVLLLLIGSFGGQVLFNAPAVAASIAASETELGGVATFQAAFQLARIPLFLAVPLQAALIPLMARILLDRGSGERAALLVRYTAGTGATIAAGVAIGWFLGPWLVQLIFGARYDAAPWLVAVLAAGSGAYLALLVLSQVFVADGRHGTVGASWACGAVVAAVVFATVPATVTASAWSFTLGSLAGLGWALAAAWRADAPGLGAAPSEQRADGGTDRGGQVELGRPSERRPDQ